MFKMWGKLIKDNHLLKDITAFRSDYSQSRTQMVFDCLDEICYELTWKADLAGFQYKRFKLHAKPALAGIIY